METISVSALKAHLSAELRKVERGATIVVLDHRRPVARLAPLVSPAVLVREPSAPYSYRDLEPLVRRDPLDALAEERADRW